MAQIKVTGYIATDLCPKTGQSGRPYISFDLLEITGYGEKQWRQHYQVWAWGKTDVDRLMKLGVKKGSKVKVTGQQKLVDAYTKGSGRTKQLKISLQDCQLLAELDSMQRLHEPDNTAANPAGELDGDRELLPE
ncbi:single-stranded DNA-binding protein [Hungatella hathewayi]|uniref:single-stranded DNA-binding protein n=1 Tax=Hungatella hathewayi TaxID=154046 RepID=UPI001FA9A02E|nr:single-stranded DNA-binding protein [Hungatella hathewayi]